MIAPKPFKYKCPKCGYSKLVKLKSDVISSSELSLLSDTCIKCKTKMEKIELNLFDQLFNIG